MASTNEKILSQVRRLHALAARRYLSRTAPSPGSIRLTRSLKQPWRKCGLIPCTMAIELSQAHEMRHPGGRDCCGSLMTDDTFLFCRGIWAHGVGQCDAIGPVISRPPYKNSNLVRGRGAHGDALRCPAIKFVRLIG